MWLGGVAARKGDHIHAQREIQTEELVGHMVSDGPQERPQESEE